MWGETDDSELNRFIRRVIEQPPTAASQQSTDAEIMWLQRLVLSGSIGLWRCTTAKQSVLKGLDGYRNKVVLLFLLVALIVALALQFFIYKFVLKRLTRLASAVQRLSYGDSWQFAAG